MPIRLVNTLLFIALLGCMALNWLLVRDRQQPNSEFLPNMVEPISYGSFAANPNFRDGKTMQEPIPGTIRRGNLPIHYQATPEDAVRAGEQLHSPFDLKDEKVLQRGAAVFTNFCQVCHGPQGLGDGTVAKQGVPPPPSLREGKSKDMKDGQLFHILTYGQANMASYAAQISREDRWRVIAHVRSLQAAPPPAAAAPTAQPAAPAAQPAAPANGEKKP